jgi:hypothetical protein
MMRWIVPLCLLLIAACDTPSPAFRGVEPVRIKVGHSMFDIRVQGRRAEAIRLNAEWAPRLEAVAPRAVAAIEAVSRCRVDRLDGDQALMTARLDCGAGPPPGPVFPDRLDCEYYELGEAYGALICRPYD